METVILKYLLSNRNKDHNIKTIAEAIGMDYKNAHTLVAKLQKASLIEIQPFGNVRRVVLTPKIHPLLFQAEYERRESIIKNKNIRLILKHLAEVPFLFVALLFGSFAKGKQTKHSDYDILTISEKEIKVLSILPLDIHITHVTPEEFIHMTRSKEFTVVSEANTYNVPLIGIEDYYRLLEYAHRTIYKSS